jgi:hypothetical protein
MASPYPGAIDVARGKFADPSPWGSLMRRHRFCSYGHSDVQDAVFDFLRRAFWSRRDRLRKALSLRGSEYRCIRQQRIFEPKIRFRETVIPDVPPVRFF